MAAVLALTLSGGAELAVASGAPPRLCWRPLEGAAVGAAASQDPVTGSEPGRLWATDGAHPAVRLIMPGDRPARPQERHRFSVRGRDPQLLLYEPGGGALKIWAHDRESAMRLLTVRLAAGLPPGCILRGTAGGTLVVVEGVSESEATTCLAWPAAAALDRRRRSATCFPIAVPDLVGRPLVEARSVLDRLELELGEVEQRLSTATATVVLEQLPAFGSGRALATGDTLDLVVARAAVPVPQIVGLRLDRAVRLLGELELAVAARSAGSSLDPDLAPGYEIGAQSPAAGSLLVAGGQVVAEVALRLPDLRARAAPEAVALLAGSGLRPQPGVVLPTGDSQPGVFSVTAHRPAAGELAAYGQTVEIDVGVRVPNLRGLRPAAARRLLAARTLELEQTGGAAPAAPAERIRVQRPVAGTVVAPATRIRAGVGVLAPEIEGATVAQALERLQRRGLGLDLGDQGMLERWRQATGRHRLEAQRPRPGTLVVSGSRVAAQLAVEMPNLRWQPFSRADSRLRELELSPDRPRPRAAGSLRHQVVGQRPEPGTWLPAGAPVQLTLGPGLAPEPPKPRWPWVWMVAVAALSGSLVRPRARKPPRQLKVSGETDFGTPKLSAAPGRSAEPAIRLRPRWDPGRQRLDTRGETDG